MTHDNVIRDEEQNIVSIESDENSNRITGPLGLWPFPIINMIVMNNNKQDDDDKLVITEIHRDNDGRI